jgi:hypothetical protein
MEDKEKKLIVRLFTLIGKLTPEQKEELSDRFREWEIFYGM